MYLEIVNLKKKNDTAITDRPAHETRAPLLYRNRFWQIDSL